MGVSGESENLEFKVSFDRESIETISAFANAKGGTVLIGVRDSGDFDKRTYCKSKIDRQDQTSGNRQESFKHASDVINSFKN